MTKIEQTIKIVSSSDPTLSSMSLPSRLAIQEILSQRFTDVSIHLVDDITDLKDLVDSQPDLVFLGMKFIPSNPALGINDPHKIWLSQYLEDAGIVCTGSTGEAHLHEINKPLAKQRVAESGLATSKFFTVDQNHTKNIPTQLNLKYPLFVKPTNRGGGLGVDAGSLAYSHDQLVRKATQIADRYQSDSLVEEFLPGREFSVSILRSPDTMQYRVMPIELVVEADDRGITMLAGDVKADNNEKISIVSEPELGKALQGLAIDAFKSIGGRDYGRIDIRLDADGQPNFLEANLIPSLIDNYGSFPKSCAMHANLSHEDMIMKIVKLAMLRQPQPRSSVLQTLLGSRTPSTII